MHIKSILIFLLSLYSSFSFADWVLVPEDSNLTFVSIKKDKVGEIHNFSELEGVIRKNGEVFLDIKLASVETNIPIRNERMKTYLFETDAFPSAKIMGKVELSKVAKLKKGSYYHVEQAVELTMHGKTKNLVAHLQVFKLNDNQIQVSTLNPVLINASDFVLSDGIAKLQELAKLPSIAHVVPVNFNFVFQK